MISQHYGTQTVNRGAVQPGMLVKHRDGTGRHQLTSAASCTFTADASVPTPKPCLSKSTLMDAETA